jgi:hypothetical protein
LCPSESIGLVIASLNSGYFWRTRRLDDFETMPTLQRDADAFSQFRDEWSVVPLQHLYGYSDKPRNVVRVYTARKHVHAKRVPESVRVRVSHSCPAT